MREWNSKKKRYFTARHAARYVLVEEDANMPRHTRGCRLHVVHPAGAQPSCPRIFTAPESARAQAHNARQNATIMPRGVVCLKPRATSRVLPHDVGTPERRHVYVQSDRTRRDAARPRGTRRAARDDAALLTPPGNRGREKAPRKGVPPTTPPRWQVYRMPGFIRHMRWRCLQFTPTFQHPPVMPAAMSRRKRQRVCRQFRPKSLAPACCTQCLEQFRWRRTIYCA